MYIVFGIWLAYAPLSAPGLTIGHKLPSQRVRSRQIMSNYIIIIISISTYTTASNVFYASVRSVLLKTLLIRRL